MIHFSPRQITSFDSVIERFSQVTTSFTEEEALQENFWNQGEDARLREDFRFRQTPGGHWMIAECLYANDELRKLFSRKHRSTLPFTAALHELGAVAGREWVFCRADNRFVLDGEELRLSEQELTSSLLAEEALELEKYVSHLPIRNLEAVAASEPQGEWGPTAQEEMGDVLGWVRVNMPGVVLNDRMFVARIKGHSMDDSRHGIVDGSYSLFELWPAGSRQGKIILVRGSFHDPETGHYAVKQYDADQRDEEGLHRRIALVSLNPDKEKYPDIELDPEDDQAVMVIAQHIESLSGQQYGREPKPVKAKRSGRRNLEQDYVKGRLKKRLEQIFGEADTCKTTGGKERKDSSLVCLDVESGGLHIETRPLTWLPNFVKKIEIQAGGKEQAVALGSNLKNLTWRQMIPPSRDGYAFAARGFEEDIGDELQGLAITGLAYDAGTIFKVDAAGIGREQRSEKLSPGQQYRIIIPPVLRVESAIIGEHHNFISGWQIWDFVLPVDIDEPLREQITGLQLKIGNVVPQLQWAATPPVDYQQTARGVTLPCFHIDQPPVLRVTGDVLLAGDLTLFVRAGSEFKSLSLPEGHEWLVELNDLPAGPALIQLLHKKTTIPPISLSFFMIEHRPPLLSGQVTMTVDDVQMVVGQEPIVEKSIDVAELDEDSFQIAAPPLWPISSFWQGTTVGERVHTYISRAGNADMELLLARTQSKRKSWLPGNWVFDFAELGRIVLQHGGNPDPDELLEQFTHLVQGKEKSLPGLVGQYPLLKQVWLDAALQLMGLEYEDLAVAEIAKAPSASTAMRLFRTERHPDGQIERQQHSMLVLVPTRKLISQKGEGSIWEFADSLCQEYGLAIAIISDGMNWMRHRQGSNMKGRVYALMDIIAQKHNNDFENFLSDCGGW